MKKQKMYNAREVAKLLNNQISKLLNIKESNIEHVTKKTAPKTKKINKKIKVKRVVTAIKNSRSAVIPKKKPKITSQKKLFSQEQKSFPPIPEMPINELRARKISVLEKVRLKEEDKAKKLSKKSSSNLFLRILKGFKRKRDK